MQPKSDWILDVLDCTDHAINRMAAIQERCLDRFIELFVAAMARHERSDVTKDILSDYNCMSVAERARLIMSGGFFELTSKVMRSSREDDDALRNLAEFIRADASVNALAAQQGPSRLEAIGRNRTWNAMGDRVAVYDDDLWTVLDAPQIGDCISLDFDSPLATATEVRSGTLSRVRLEPTEEEKLIIANKLQTALSLIDEVEPIYGLLIRTFTRRVIIRISVRSDDVTVGNRPVSSEHVSRQPGCIRMLNPHLDEKSIASCMESLLHESIHVFMSSIENGRSHHYTSRTLQFRPVSPWSGNLIPNSAYCHAIFIYYACKRLFEKSLDSLETLDASERGKLLSRLQFVCAGFEIDQPLSKLFVDAGDLDSGLVAAIDTVQTRSSVFIADRRFA